MLQNPFFLLFCATSGVGAYLGHRLFIRRLSPGGFERGIALVASLLSLALSYAAHAIRTGSLALAVDASAAGVVAAFTGLGIAFVCLHCVGDLRRVKP